jgi:XRE family transcriptional regulator, regulator of sulfur utilization
MPLDQTEPLLAAFGAAVREQRLRRGLSQDALADLAGFQRTYLSEVETGRRNVTLVNIGRLAAALGVGVGELMATAEGRLSSTEGVAP